MKKNKNVAGILAMLFGVFGGHHLYLGNTNRAGLCLLFALFPIGTLFLFIKGIVDGVRFFRMTESEFRTYCEKMEKGEKRGLGISAFIEKMKLIGEYRALLNSGAITRPEFKAICKWIMEA